MAGGGCFFVGDPLIAAYVFLSLMAPPRPLSSLLLALPVPLSLMPPHRSCLPPPPAPLVNHRFIPQVMPYSSPCSSCQPSLHPAGHNFPLPLRLLSTIASPRRSCLPPPLAPLVNPHFTLQVMPSSPPCPSCQLSHHSNCPASPTPMFWPLISPPHRSCLPAPSCPSCQPVHLSTDHPFPPPAPLCVLACRPFERVQAPFWPPSACGFKTTGAAR